MKNTEIIEISDSSSDDNENKKSTTVRISTTNISTNSRDNDNGDDNNSNEWEVYDPAKYEDNSRKLPVRISRNHRRRDVAGHKRKRNSTASITTNSSSASHIRTNRNIEVINLIDDDDDDDDDSDEHDSTHQKNQNQEMARNATIGTGSKSRIEGREYSQWDLYEDKCYFLLDVIVRYSNKVKKRSKNHRNRDEMSLFQYQKYATKLAISRVLQDILKENGVDLRFSELNDNNSVDDSGISVDNLICSKCRSGEANEVDNNDLVLCDRINCGRVYHQKCLIPHIKSQELFADPWFCRECNTINNCLNWINTSFHISINNVNDMIDYLTQGEDKWGNFEEVYPEFNPDKEAEKLIRKRDLMKSAQQEKMQQKEHQIQPVKSKDSSRSNKRNTKNNNNTNNHEHHEEEEPGESEGTVYWRTAFKRLKNATEKYCFNHETLRVLSHQRSNCRVDLQQTTETTRCRTQIKTAESNIKQIFAEMAVFQAENSHSSESNTDEVEKALAYLNSALESIGDERRFEQIEDIFDDDQDGDGGNGAMMLLELDEYNEAEDEDYDPENENENENESENGYSSEGEDMSEGGGGGGAYSDYDEEEETSAASGDEEIVRGRYTQQAALLEHTSAYNNDDTVEDGVAPIIASGVEGNNNQPAGGRRLRRPWEHRDKTTTEEYESDSSVSDLDFDPKSVIRQKKRRRKDQKADENNDASGDSTSSCSSDVEEYEEVEERLMARRELTIQELMARNGKFRRKESSTSSSSTSSDESKHQKASQLKQQLQHQQSKQEDQKQRQKQNQQLKQRQQQQQQRQRREIRNEQAQSQQPSQSQQQSHEWSQQSHQQQQREQHIERRIESQRREETSSSSSSSDESCTDVDEDMARQVVSCSQPGYSQEQAVSVTSPPVVNTRVAVGPSTSTEKVARSDGGGGVVVGGRATRSRTTTNAGNNNSSNNKEPVICKGIEFASDYEEVDSEASTASSEGSSEHDDNDSDDGGTGASNSEDESEEEEPMTTALSPWPCTTHHQQQAVVRVSPISSPPQTRPTPHPTTNNSTAAQPHKSAVLIPSSSSSSSSSFMRGSSTPLKAGLEHAQNQIKELKQKIILLLTNNNISSLSPVSTLQPVLMTAHTYLTKIRTLPMEDTMVICSFCEEANVEDNILICDWDCMKCAVIKELLTYINYILSESFYSISSIMRHAVSLIMTTPSTKVHEDIMESNDSANDNMLAQSEQILPITTTSTITPTTPMSTAIAPLPPISTYPLALRGKQFSNQCSLSFHIRSENSCIAKNAAYPNNHSIEKKNFMILPTIRTTKLPIKTASNHKNMANTKNEDIANTAPSTSHSVNRSTTGSSFKKNEIIDLTGTDSE